LSNDLKITSKDSWISGFQSSDYEQCTLLGSACCLLLLVSLAYSSTLKTEVICVLEMSGLVKTTWRYKKTILFIEYWVMMQLGGGR
jgi:hypothetical protein